MTTIARLRGADPVTWLRDETDVDAPPPADVLARIVAIPPPEPPRRRRRALIAVPVAAVLAVGLALVLLLPSSADRVDLAAKAYAKTAPGDAVVYTEWTIERTMPTGDDVTRDRIQDRSWQYRGRAHRLSTTIGLSGHEEGKCWDYEYDVNGDTMRILNPDGTVDTIRVGDPGWKTDEPEMAIRGETMTMVDRFREEYADAQLRDAGETTFAGRRAHAYEVLGQSKPGDSPKRETFYLDAESGLPLGSVTVFRFRGVSHVDPRTGRLRATPESNVEEHRFTEIVDRYERLPPTPENLARLDAPAIDAGKPRITPGR